MRANNVGTIIRGRLEMRDYIPMKYDGLFPEGYPTKKEYIEVCRALRNDPRNPDLKKKKVSFDKKIENFQRDWRKLQTTA